MRAILSDFLSLIKGIAWTMPAKKKPSRRYRQESINKTFSMIAFYHRDFLSPDLKIGWPGIC